MKKYNNYGSLRGQHDRIITNDFSCQTNLNYIKGSPISISAVDSLKRKTKNFLSRAANKLLLIII